MNAQGFKLTVIQTALFTAGRPPLHYSDRLVSVGLGWFAVHLHGLYQALSIVLKILQDAGAGEGHYERHCSDLDCSGGSGIP